MPSNAEAVDILGRGRRHTSEVEEINRPGTLTKSGRARVHAVRFFPDDASLCRLAAEFLQEGLTVGEPAIVVATPAHRERIESELESLSHDIAQLQRSGRLVLLDTAEVLNEILVKGEPDSVRFTKLLTGAIDRVCRGRRNCTVRIYGEVVDVLWKAGMHETAIRLEMLWNQLASTREFSLLCGYSMGSFYKDSQFHDVCGRHNHVTNEPDQSGEPSTAQPN
jgi:hypothetical protein